MIVYILSRAWIASLSAFLWILDTGCDQVSNGFTRLLHLLIFQWMRGDDQ